MFRIIGIALGVGLIFKAFTLKEKSLSDKKKNRLKNIQVYLWATKIYNFLLAAISISVVWKIHYTEKDFICCIAISLIYCVVIMIDTNKEQS